MKSTEAVSTFQQSKPHVSKRVNPHVVKHIDNGGSAIADAQTENIRNSEKENKSYKIHMKR
jgi:hypothetical protein